MKKRTSWLMLLCLAAAMAVLDSVAQAADVASIDVRLIYGTNDDKPSEEAIGDLKDKFKPDFGYRHYRQLAAQQIELNAGESRSLDLGHKIQLAIKHVESRKKYHILQCDLFHEGKKLLFIELSVPQKSVPVFIKGPWTDKGLVIIALKAK